MKPAAFDFVRARDVPETLDALAGAEGEGKVLAGGQSLLPMLNFRLLKPSILVDINGLPGLDRVEHEGDRVRIGALVRHVTTARDPIVARRTPIVADAMKHVAHLTVRNRGTFCGSVCHADPAGEMPMVATLLDGRVHAVSTRGERVIPIDTFLAGTLSTTLEPDELVTAIDLASVPDGTGHGFHEYARRHGDYALAAAGVLLRRAGGLARDVRIAVMGVGEVPGRVRAAETCLEGQAVTDETVAAAIAALRDNIAPGSDLNASADYRRHLAGVLASRALRDAWDRAGRAGP